MNTHHRSNLLNNMHWLKEYVNLKMLKMINYAIVVINLIITNNMKLK